jgi:tryptophan synthase beta chain
MGIFSGFFVDSECHVYGVEPSGRSLRLGNHAATDTYGKTGIIHGYNCYFLQGEQGVPAPDYSIASGFDYLGVRPEHSMLKDLNSGNYVVASNNECVGSFLELNWKEGIIPARKSAHAVAFALKLAKEKPRQSILVNLIGLGDKDIDFIVDKYGTG